MRILCASILGLLLVVPSVRAQEPDSAAQPQPVLHRFLPTADAPPVAYRAIRRMTARAGDRWASLTARTSFDPSTGFTYAILDEQGSGLIRSKVLSAALEAERSAKQ